MTPAANDVKRQANTAEGGTAVFTFQFHKEGHMWVGECVELGTATDGRSLEKVSAELMTLVTLHLEGLAAIGERERVFAERGIVVFAGDVPARLERCLPVVGDTTLVQLRSLRLSVSVPQAVVA